MQNTAATRGRFELSKQTLFVNTVPPVLSTVEFSSVGSVRGLLRHVKSTSRFFHGHGFQACFDFRFRLRNARRGNFNFYFAFKTLEGRWA